MRSTTTLAACKRSAPPVHADVREETRGRGVPTGDAHRDAHARVMTRQRGVKAGSPKGSFLNSAGVPAMGPAIPPNTPGGEFLTRVSDARVLPGAPHGWDQEPPRRPADAGGPARQPGAGPRSTRLRQ